MKKQEIITLLAFFLCSCLSSFDGYSQAAKSASIGKNVTFSTTAVGDSYQWQEDNRDGTGFTNINNGGIYSGATTNTLIIRGVTVPMDTFRYKCIVNVATASGKTINVNEGKVDTLKVITGITPIYGITIAGDNISMSSDAPAGSNLQWQCDKGFGFKDIPGVNQATYNPVATCATNNYKYRCGVTDAGKTIYSNVDTVMVSGCLVQHPTNISVGTKTMLAVSHKKDPAITYKWQVCPNNSGTMFKDISDDDSDVYSGYGKDTLVFKNTGAFLNGAKYRCTATVNGIVISSDTFTLSMTGKIGVYDNVNRFQLMGALYSGLQGAQDDNAANFTQIYIRANIFRKTSSLDINTEDRTVWFRNMFTQITWSTNADAIRYYNVRADSFNKQDTAKYRAVNRLDLLKNANFNINIMVPVWTHFFPGYKPHYGDAMHMYIDPFGALLISTINNKNLRDSAHAMHVFSLQYGLNVGLRSEDLRINKLPLCLEFQAKVFWISALSNSIDPNLNYQESKITNDYTPGVSKSAIGLSNHPYFNFDGLIIYNTSATSTSNVFLHASFFTNFVSPVLSPVYNNYWQLQAGYALDLNSFWTS